MSEREPITAELRELMGGVEPRVGEDGVVTAKYVTPEAWAEFVRRCDAIDAVHAGLERENAELRERLAVLDNRSDSMHIGGATVTITDELREWWVRKFPVMDKELHEDFTAIADRIDAEHERLMRERKGCIHYDQERHYCNVHDFTTEDYKRGYDDGFASADDWLGQHESAMAEHGWVRGPLGKDGKLWRSGDMSDSNWGEIWGIAYENGKWFIRGHDTSAPWIPADSIGHYHAPTVEDVLTKFGIDWEYEDNCEDRAALLKEYAKRLRLAGDAE